MAATIARAIGRTKDSERETTRLGHESSEAQANTFKTFTTSKVNKDGSGEVKVERVVNDRRVVILHAKFGPEDRHDWNTVEIENVGLCALDQK